jgi:rubredoxin
MEVDYFRCSSCGYETEHIRVRFSRTCANGDFVYCPHCNAEVSAIESKEEE